MATKYPKWVTPERQTHLVNLFHVSRGFCVFGHKCCPNPSHHYEDFINDLIRDWVSDDKAQRNALWQVERRQLHSLGESREPLRGRFSIISRDVFFTEQPRYYVLGFGISGLTLKPFAKVRLSSTFIVLYIELDKLREVSKAQKRKSVRYGKRLPQIEERVKLAVKHYLR